MAMRFDDSGFSRRSLLKKSSVVLTASAALSMSILRPPQAVVSRAQPGLWLPAVSLRTSKLLPQIVP